MENSEAMTHNSLITYHPENFTHGQGEARAVLRVTTLGWPGAYAPLTESGELLVDGTCLSCHRTEPGAVEQVRVQAGAVPASLHAWSCRTSCVMRRVSVKLDRS